MANFTSREKDIIRIACSVIRDQSKGWSGAELQEQPESICQKLSDLIGDTFNFESGEVTCVTTNDSGDQHFPEDDR